MAHGRLKGGLIIGKLYGGVEYTKEIHDCGPVVTLRMSATMYKLDTEWHKINGTWMTVSDEMLEDL